MQRPLARLPVVPMTIKGAGSPALPRCLARWNANFMIRWRRRADVTGLGSRRRIGNGRLAMAKKQTSAVYKIVEVVGVSETSWEEAGRNAVETAAGSLRDLRVAEVTKMDMKVEEGKVAAFRTRVSLSFKYEA